MSLTPKQQAILARSGTSKRRRTVIQEFETGDTVRITFGDYEGRTGEIVDSDYKATINDYNRPVTAEIYQVEGDGIDPDDPESWVEGKYLELIED